METKEVLREEQRKILGNWSALDPVMVEWKVCAEPVQEASAVLLLRSACLHGPTQSCTDNCGMEPAPYLVRHCRT